MGSWFSDQGSNPLPPALKFRMLSTGLPRSPKLACSFNISWIWFYFNKVRLYYYFNACSYFIKWIFYVNWTADAKLDFVSKYVLHKPLSDEHSLQIFTDKYITWEDMRYIYIYKALKILIKWTHSCLRNRALSRTLEAPWRPCPGGLISLASS